MAANTQTQAAPQATQQKELKQDYWSYVKRQFKKNKRALFSFYFIGFLALIAIFADFLANEKPIVAKYEGSVHFPIFQSYLVDWGIADYPEAFKDVISYKDLDYDWSIWPLIPYLPSNIDQNNLYTGPTHNQTFKCMVNRDGMMVEDPSGSNCDKKEVKMQTPNYKPNMSNEEMEAYFKSQEYSKWRHWMGTDDKGRDVAAGMIYGTRTAFLVGIVSMSIAFFIGLIFGSLAGYFGDTELRVSRIRLILVIFSIPFALFYGFLTRGYIIGDAFAEGLGGVWQLLISGLIFIGIIALAALIAVPLKKIPFLGKKVTVPMDILVTRFIEIIVSIPTLILILAVVAFLEPSIFNVMAVIGMTGWTGIARFIRAELLRVRRLEYMEAAKALGYSRLRSILKHAVPNALSPVFIALAFGIAGAILIESFLSFLGIGVPAEMLTWGKLLSISRSSSAAWWLAIFPGFAIFLTVTLFNLVGEGLTDALDPRLKQ